MSRTICAPKAPPKVWVKCAPKPSDNNNGSSKCEPVKVVKCLPVKCKPTNGDSNGFKDSWCKPDPCKPVEYCKPVDCGPDPV